MKNLLKFILFTVTFIAILALQCVIAMNIK